MKGPPSATSKHQPCDVSDNFRDIKTGFRSVESRGIDVTNHTLRANLLSVIKNFNELHNCSKVTAEFGRKIIYASEKISYVMKNDYFTASKITEGFVRTGQHVIAASPNNLLTVDYHKIMSRCLSKISEEDYDNLESIRDRVVQKFRSEGRVTNGYLDELHATNTGFILDRDDLTMCRQDACLITHVDTIARYAELQRLSFLRTDPASIRLTKEKADAQAFLLKEKAQNKRKIDAELRQQEKKRKDSTMTKEEKQAEAASKRKARQSLIAQKAKEHSERKQHALDILGTDSADLL